MADLLAWSDRKAEALELYRRALIIKPDDPHLQEAVRTLGGQTRPFVQTAAEHFTDSGSLSAQSFITALDGGEARGHSLLARICRQQAQTDGPRHSLRGEEFTLGLAGGIGPGWTARVETGASRYGRLPVRLRWDGTVSLRTLRCLSLNLRHSYGERGFELRSLAAMEAGIRGHEIALSGYRAMGAKGGVFFRLRGGFLSDRNQYRGGDVSLDRTLVTNDRTLLPGGQAGWIPGIRTALALYAIDYTKDTGIYYAPEREWSGTVQVLPAWRWSRTDVSLTLLAGRAGNRQSDGNVWGTRFQGDWHLTGETALEAGFAYDQSVRTSTYISRLARLGIRWGWE
jgi:hypothetical protein